MFISTFSRAAIPAAVLAGLAATSLDAQTTARDDSGPDGSRVFWLSAAGLTSAVVFASFLSDNHQSAAVRTPTQVSNPTGAPMGAPVLLPGTGTSSTSGTSGSNQFAATPSPVGAAATPNATTTPEPSTLALFATGILGLVPLARRRRG
jgi:hypothetical protein